MCGLQGHLKKKTQSARAKPFPGSRLFSCSSVRGGFMHVMFFCFCCDMLCELHDLMWTCVHISSTGRKGRLDGGCFPSHMMHQNLNQNLQIHKLDMVLLNDRWLENHWLHCCSVGYMIKHDKGNKKKNRTVQIWRTGKCKCYLGVCKTILVPE